jgi:mono/diheme cytochrome c family protein
MIQSQHWKQGTESMCRRLWLRTLVLSCLAILPAAGCRQKMAEQPYYRPYEPAEFFEDGRSSRPLEPGVIHRGQYLESDPLVTGLTREEWGRIYSRETNHKLDLNAPPVLENRDKTYGAPRYYPPEFLRKFPGLQIEEKLKGAAIYVDEYPFAITAAHLKRGQERFTIYCAVCHGPLGNGQGKIWERGYLTPTSFHTTMVGENEKKLDHPIDLPLGFSRGYSLWGIRIPLREVPVGYIFEVITKGFAGMPSYSAQIQPEDRWKIIAYIRTLQLSQHATPDELVNAGGKK